MARWALAAAARSDDPAVCTEQATQAYLEQVTGLSGAAAVADGASPDAGNCVVSHLDELSDEEIARTAIEAGELDRIYAECGIAG